MKILVVNYGNLHFLIDEDVNWDDPFIESDMISSDENEECLETDMNMDNVDSSDDNGDSAMEGDCHDPLQEAIRMAEEQFDFLDMPSRACHCCCKMYNGCPCIEQFSQDEQESIRYKMQAF